MGFQKCFVINTPMAVNKATINGQRDPIIALPVPGSRYEKTTLLDNTMLIAIIVNLETTFFILIILIRSFSTFLVFYQEVP